MAITVDKRAYFGPNLSISDAPTMINITEKDIGGAGTFTFQIDAPSASLTVQGQKIFFCTNGQCADGGFIIACPDGIHIHLVELKSKVSTQKWDAAKRQLEGMFHNLLAISAIADLGAPASVMCHVAYKEDAIAASPVLSKAITGTGPISTTALEWMSGSVELGGFKDVQVRKYMRDANGDAAAEIEC